MQKKNIDAGELNGWLNDTWNSVTSAVAELDPTNHNSWLGNELHNAADAVGDATGVNAQQFQQLWTTVASTALNIAVPGAGVALSAALNSTWGAALQASAAEEARGAAENKARADIAALKIQYVKKVTDNQVAFSKKYPNSPQFAVLYAQGANNAVNQLFDGDFKLVNQDSINALTPILQGSLVKVQMQAAAQKEYDIANPPTTTQPSELMSAADSANVDAAGNPRVITRGTSTGTPEVKKDNTMVVVAVVGGALTITGIIVWVMMNKKKQSVNGTPRRKR